MRVQRVARFGLATGAAAVCLTLIVPSAGASTSVARGRFHSLPAGTSMGLTITGEALLVRFDNTTRASIAVSGLKPGAKYAAHVHTAPCSAANPGGGHYKYDPNGAGAPPNELWLSSTGSPTGGIRANSIGKAGGTGLAPWVAGPTARAIVIHYIPPGGTTAGGPKIACADLT